MVLWVKEEGALNIILDMCRRSVPVKGDAGYFFHQTQDGFKFKSIDFLLSQKPNKNTLTLVHLNQTKRIVTMI